MENKTTIELLELLNKAPKEGEKGYDEFWASEGKYEQLMGELETREPFVQILGKDWDTSLPAVWEAIEKIIEDIKKLKRHKHEEKSGDVVVRI
jgi:hypothetical protein